MTPHGDPLGKIGEPDIGGQCVYVRELSARLAVLGAKVTALTRDRGNGKAHSEEISPGAKVIRIPCGPSGFIPKENLLPYLGEFAARARSYLGGAKVLHSHYWDGGYVAAMLRNGRFWVHTPHSLGKLKQASLPDKGRYRYAERIKIETEIYSECDRVIALTRKEKEDLTSLYGVPGEKIIVIPPGVDTHRFRPPGDKEKLKRLLGLPHKRPAVFSLGRLDERKGFDLYFHAAATVIKKTRGHEPIFVLSAGAGHPDEEEERAKLERLIESLDIGKWVRWLKVLPEETLTLYYGAADVFVLPSRYEPFGIVMLEAMACGLPVVATVFGGPAEVIVNGVDGILVDPTDIDAMAEAILELLSDPEKRKSMGEKARARVVSRYSWTRVVREVWRVYAGEDRWPK